MTGGGGLGGPRGIFLCLNFGGSIGSCCLSTIFMIRSFFLLVSPIWFAGVYRTYVGSALFPPLTFLGFWAATAPLTSFSNASFVFSVDAATSSSLGLSKLRSPASALWRRGMRSLKLEWTIRFSLWPCRAIASYLTLPSASTWIASAFDVDAVPEWAEEQDL